MGVLLKREWKRWWRKLVVPLIFYLLILFVMLVVYILKQEELVTFVFRMFWKPRELVALSGYQSWEGMGNAAYYLLFVMMFFHVEIAWRACIRTLHIVYMDEENQSVYSLCNQLYSRGKLAVSKYLWALCSFLFLYSVLSVCLWGMTAVGNHIHEQITDYRMLMTYSAKAALIISMLISLTFLYAVWTKRINGYTKHGFVSILVLGTFFVGNLYKLRDVLIYFFNKYDLTTGLIERMTVWMSHDLRRFSPLSWMNPEVDFSRSLVMFCVAVIILSFMMGMIGYQRRRL